MKELFEAEELTQERLSLAQVTREELEGIYLKYLSVRSHYLAAVNAIRETLSGCTAVHSLKTRTKEPSSLLFKIVQKRIDKLESGAKLERINADNFEKHITDLAGIRALHLFKDDWASIHDFVITSFLLVGSAEAWHNRADSPEYLSSLTENEILPKLHPKGYRSLHYLLEVRISKETQIVELQTRTLQEEAWSEIDHRMRYKSDCPVLLSQSLNLFNSLCSQADLTASHIRKTKRHLDQEIEENQLKEKLVIDLRRRLKTYSTTDLQQHNLDSFRDNCVPELLEITHKVASLLTSNIRYEWVSSQAIGTDEKVYLHLEDTHERSLYITEDGMFPSFSVSCSTMSQTLDNQSQIVITRNGVEVYSTRIGALPEDSGLRKGDNLNLKVKEGDHIQVLWDNTGVQLASPAVKVMTTFSQVLTLEVKEDGEGLIHSQDPSTRPLKIEIQRVTMPEDDKAV